MRKLLSTLAVVLAASLAAPGTLFAQEGVPIDAAPDRTGDLISLQHGAKLFVNYCLNCHSADVVRYSKLEDLGIPAKLIEQDLLFTTDKIGNTMTIAMRPEDAKEWLGVRPPDLAVEARARTPGWIYTYLRSFYRDETRPTGWNNLVFPNVSMPNVLWQLQGQRIAHFVHEGGEEAGTPPKFAAYEQITPGTMSAADYDSAVADLVTYMSWMAEPELKRRKQIGVWVLLFIAGFGFLTWRLNAAYWKDIK